MREVDVLIIGAGPVGVATAAQLLQKGLTPVLLEKGETAGRAMLEWGHVRVFTPWRLMIDPAVVALLEDAGWDAPDGDLIPTGKEIVKNANVFTNSCNVAGSSSQKTSNFMISIQLMI